MTKPMQLKSSDFVHLHNHTQYSLLDGLTKIPELMDQVLAFGMDAVAMTDHGSLSGAIEFYKSANEKKIKPIIGLEAYISERKLSDKEVGIDKKYYHLIILAMNNHGYKNLMRLSTIAHLEGFYYKPRIDRETLEKYSEGLIILSGCINGELGDALRQDQYDKALGVAKWYKKTFGDRYYIEIQDHGHPEHNSSWEDQTKVNTACQKLAKELDIPMVITGDAHYLRESDQDAHEILLCVQTGSFLEDEGRMSLKDFELFVADPKDVIKRWGKELPGAVLNTKKIAERCDLKIELGNYLIPKFEVPKGETEKSHLNNLTFKGLLERYEPDVKPKQKLEDLKKQLKPEVRKRAEYELSVIDRMGFNGYFLIVQDFINWGKDKGIVFGPGRGSGAGSIVAYGLRITELDPLQYDLLFERFLNPDRISMPDFDIDIQDTRRDEVIDYCVKKYGEDRVANIVTFGRMAARNAVRDVARVLQVPYSEADRLAKMIPPPIQGRHIPLQQSLMDDADLKREYQTNADAKKVFDLAIKLEGTIRSHGVHAAGVVIAPDDIVNFTPLEMAQKGVVSTQYSMGPIEEIGLLKMDFLGLSNLTIVKNALRIIKKVENVDIDISTIPLDDAKTYKLFQRGDTTGVFQLESAGMKRYLKELKPTLFEDIIAMVALYRPGPMAEFPRFIAGKNNPRTISYPHPSLEPVLKDTYGVMVFQEQIIALLQLIAGYSPGEADLIRKAIGKKNRQIMQAEKPRFIEGCLAQGLNKDGAEKLWALIQPFSDYSFNKAHAACYALIAYQTAYLKANFPLAFMAALMTSDFDNTDRLAIEMGECKSMQIEVLPPDVNESFGEFAIVPGKKQIRFGMNAIKNVGSGAVDEIILAREKDGKFKSVEDFLKRVSSGLINKKVIESLVKTGAFDSFTDRSLLANNVENMVLFASKIQKTLAAGQTDLFEDDSFKNTLASKLELIPGEPISNQTQLAWERELMGLYLSHHPLSDHKDELSAHTPLSQVHESPDEMPVTSGGILMEVKEIVTKKGQKMAFAKLEDSSGNIEIIAFPGVYDSLKEHLIKDKIVIISGRVSTRDKTSGSGDAKIILSDIKDIGDSSGLKQAKPAKSKPFKSSPVYAEKRVYVRLENAEDENVLRSLKNEMDKQPGTVPLVLVVGPEKSKQIIKLPSSIEPSDNFIENMKQLFGEESVKYQ